ncbi:MAG: phosphoglycerate kinase [Candidatus Buchananbacteria bacterium]
MNIRSIQSIKNLAGQTALVRVDFNVKLKGDRVVNNQKIVESLPTIKLLQKKGVKIILCSHLGRPNGHKVKEFSLRPVANELARLLKQPVAFIQTDLIKNFDFAKKQLAGQSLSLLENIRFYPEEEKNSPKLAKLLAGLAELFVMDAFGTIHRAQASTEKITHYLPSYAGLLVIKEAKNLSQALNPKHPAVAIIGGAKISDKILIIKNLLTKYDYLLLGGALANNFLAAKGFDIKQSLIEPKQLNLAKKLLANKKIIIPQDYIFGKLNNQEMILDLGPKTIKQYCQLIKSAKSIIWNGPLGYFEQPQFARATKTIARAITTSSAKAVLGGGETLTALKGLKIKNNIFVSTGGGAMLEFFSGQTLPGLKKLIIN